MPEQRQAVRFLVDGGLSVPRACALIGIPRTTFLYTAKPEDNQELLARIRELAARHPRYGYRRISVLLRRTTTVNEKRVRRAKLGVGLFHSLRDRLVSPEITPSLAERIAERLPWQLTPPADSIDFGADTMSTEILAALESDVRRDFAGPVTMGTDLLTLVV